MLAAISTLRRLALCLLLALWAVPAAAQVAVGQSGNPIILPGTGAPEGAVTGSVGDVYLRTDGGASTTMCLKESGSATNTGWKCAITSGAITGTTGQAAYFSGTNVISGENALLASRGGTGFGSYTVGDILYANTATTFSALQDVALGQVIISGGVGAAPAYSATPVVTSLSAPSLISTAGITMTPAAGSSLSVSLSTTGDFKVNTTQFIVDTSASKIGIGTATPYAHVQVAAATTPYLMLTDTAAEGTAKKLQLFYDTVADVGKIQAIHEGSGYTELALNPGGGAVSVAGLLNANGGIAVDTNAFTVADSTGDTVIAGTLGVTGVSTLTGLANANGGIAVDTNKFTVADGTGNTVVAGTLGVTGISTLTGLLNANGGIAVDTNKFTVADGTGNTVVAGLANLNGGLAMDTDFFTVGDGTGNTDTKGYVGSLGFASQTTGWRCTFAGSCDMRYGFFDELHAKAFIADLEQALAGGQIISKSVGILVSLTCPAASATATLTVEDLPGAPDMQIFDTGDSVAIRTFSRALQTLTVADCVGVVSVPDTSGSGTQSWTFTRNAAAGAGTMSGATVIPAGTIVLDYGTTGNGYYEVNAVDGLDAVNSPYAQIVTWATAPVAANRTVRTRFGKLTGITAEANEFGMLAGTYAASNGQFFRASNSTFELHGIDLKMWDGVANTVILSRGTGSTGGAGVSPYLGIGATAPVNCCTTAGIYVGWDGVANLAKASFYTDANNYLTFNGAVLTWKAANTTLDASGNLTASSATLSGAVTANTGYLGGVTGWVITASQIADAAGVVGLSAATDDPDDVRIWAGDATPTLAEFQVTEAGVLTAKAGTIGGVTLADGYMYTGTATTNCTTGTGFRIDASNICGVNTGATQVNIASSTGRLTAGAGNVTLDANGIKVAPDTTLNESPSAYLNGYGFSWTNSQVGGIYAIDYEGTSRLREQVIETRVVASDTGAAEQALVRLRASYNLGVGGAQSASLLIGATASSPTFSLNAAGGTGTITAATIDLNGTLVTSATVTIIDNLWIGLGSAAGRIEFDDTTVDEVNILSANVGFGSSTPPTLLSNKTAAFTAGSATNAITWTSTQTDWAAYLSSEPAAGAAYTLRLDSTSDTGIAFYVTAGATPSARFSINNNGETIVSNDGTGDQGAYMLQAVTATASVYGMLVSNSNVTTSYGLSVVVGTDTVNTLVLTDSDGACTHNPEAASEVVACSSSRALKDDIQDATGALDILAQYRVRDYLVRASGDRRWGVVFDEAPAFAQRVVTADPQLQTIIDMVEQPSPWLLLKAIQELEERLAVLEHKP